MKQLRILHLSDLHFGPEHRCGPEDLSHPRVGFPLLFDLVQQDLQSDLFLHNTWRPGYNGDDNRLLIVVTGDLTQTATDDEFEAAYSFLNKFEGASLLHSTTTRGDLFVVPGNHDIVYDTDNIITRHTPFTNFYSRLYSDVRPTISPHQWKKLTQVHIAPDRSFLVAEINTTAYVKKGTPDAQRGCIDVQTLADLDAQLGAIQDAEREPMIRIAIMHHHPILLPDLVEPNRGYDAVVNSNHLLKLLRRYGFHLVLHGHKHFPHLFSYDADSAWQERSSPSMLVVAGGSVASRGLPPGQRRHNSYNLMSIKWHPEASQARVRIVTRGLVAEGGDGELLPHRWKWITLRDINRHLYSVNDLPTPAHALSARAFDSSNDSEREDKRSDVYRETRWNMVVSEVLPSLIPGQAYEVRVWILPHVNKEGIPNKDWNPPQRVVWSAGRMFPVKECVRADDTKFSCSFNYWGPMLVQAELHFSDGPCAYAHTYARIPGLEVSQGGGVVLNPSEAK